MGRHTGGHGWEYIPPTSQQLVKKESACATLYQAGQAD